ENGVVAEDGVARHWHHVEVHERGDGRLCDETMGMQHTQGTGEGGEAHDVCPHGTPVWNVGHAREWTTRARRWLKPGTRRTDPRRRTSSAAGINDEGTR